MTNDNKTPGTAESSPNAESSAAPAGSTNAPNPPGTAVKICGLKNLADARYASGAGADFLGFIQYPASPRYISAEFAKEIIGWLYGAKTVGVFFDEEAEVVNAKCELAGFHFAQLHGNESPAYCEWIDRPIIKVIKVMPDSTRAQLEQEIAAFSHVAEYFLFDTGHVGGSGKSFDWSLIQGITSSIPYFVAGGLNPANVRSAIEITQPFGVDVASGVEISSTDGNLGASSSPTSSDGRNASEPTERGAKDFAKIDAFLENVRNGAVL